MKKPILLSLAISTFLVSSAFAAGTVAPITNNEAALASLGSTLTQSSYSGFNAQGAPCRVSVSKMGGFQGGAPVQVMITGSEALPGFVGISHESSFFQLTSNPRLTTITDYSDTPELLTVSVIAMDSTGLTGGSYWQGSIVIRRNDAGRVAYIITQESSFDPISNMTSTRQFACGQPGSF